MRVKRKKKKNLKEYYLPFQLYLLQDVIKNPREGLENILLMGIYNYAKTFKYDLENVYRQICYAYYQETLPEELKDVIENEDYFPMSETKGFDESGTFFSHEEILFLTDYGESCKEFEQKCIEYYQICQALELVSPYRYSVNAILDKIGQFEWLRQDYYEKCPLVMIKSEMILELLDYKTENEPEIMLFLAFAAIKSIVGKSPYVVTTKDFIVCRMIGVNSPKELNVSLDDDSLRTVYEKYSKRYPFDKLMKELQNRKLVAKVGLTMASRGKYFLSTSLDLEEMTKVIEAHYLKRKDKFVLLKQQETKAKELIKKAMRQP